MNIPDAFKELAESSTGLNIVIAKGNGQALYKYPTATSSNHISSTVKVANQIAKNSNGAEMTNVILYSGDDFVRIIGRLDEVHWLQVCDYGSHNLGLAIRQYEQFADLIE